MLGNNGGTTNENNTDIPVRTRLKAGLLAAMKARQQETVATLRSMLAAIDNAEAVEIPEDKKGLFGRSGDVPRRLLTEDDIRAILMREAEARRVNLVEYEQHGKEAYADRLRAELALFDEYLRRHSE